MDLLRPEQQAAAAETLAQAFHEDPLALMMAPDEGRRREAGRSLSGTIVRYGLRWGRVWTNEDVSSVAVWLPPGEKFSTIRALRVGMGVLPFRAGVGGMRRMMATMSLTEGFHKSVKGPHWYLMTLGTRPDRQGHGHGSRLIEEGTSRADAAGVPCYLETASEANVAYYRKRGFEVIGEGTVHGVTLYGMVRPPAAVQPKSPSQPTPST
jgi:ribosomal protein S18 acetylase RimI-like enzyme